MVWYAGTETGDARVVGLSCAMTDWAAGDAVREGAGVVFSLGRT